MKMTYAKIESFDIVKLKLYAIRGELFIDCAFPRAPKKIVNIVDRCVCSDEVKGFSFGCGCYTPERLENLVKRGVLLHGISVKRFEPVSKKSDSTVRIELSVTSDELKKVSDSLIEMGIGFKVTPNE